MRRTNPEMWWNNLITFHWHKTEPEQFSFSQKEVYQADNVLTRECALPGQKVRSEAMSNRKSVLKLDNPENFSGLFAVRTFT